MACDTGVRQSRFFLPLSTDSSSQLGALIDGIAHKAHLKIPRFKIARIGAGMHSFKVAVQHIRFPMCRIQAISTVKL